jgi:hypothetical protein
MTGPILKLTDGTTSISLVTSAGQKGFHLDVWLPEIANYKGGGIRRNNSRADGESLSGKQWANVTEEFRTIVDGEDQDAVITTLQNLRRLFEKASDYWTTPWQNEPVWIEASGSCETNTRYSIVIRGHMPQDGNPHAQPFFAEPSIIGETGSGFLISVERQPWWLEQIPGTGICAEASGEQEDWDYVGWTVNSALPAGRVRFIAELQSVSGRMIAGEQTNQVWRTDNGGTTPWVAATTPPTMDCVAFAEDTTTGYLYIAGDAGGGARETWRSTDGAINWTRRSAVRGTSGTRSLIYASDGYLYLADTTGPGIYRSNDGAAIWTKVSPGSLTFNCIFQASGGAFFSSNQTIIYRSVNGTDWAPVFDTQSGATLTGFDEPGDGFIYCPTAIGLFRSSDGLIWTQVSSVGTPLHNIIIDSDGIYWSTDFEDTDIYKSADGFSWVLAATIAGENLSTIIEYSGNQLLYVGASGDIYWRSPAPVTVGRTETCNNEVMIVNNQHVAQLTHVKVDDGGVFTDNFPGTLPFDLLPDPFAVNDAVYFGIDTSLVDTGPFDNLALDIGTVLEVTTATLIWEYCTNAVGPVFSTLNVQDGTKVAHAFQRAGVGTVHWMPPTDWVECTIDGITGYWVRLRVSALGAHIQTPTQQNRDIYTCNWPRVDIDDAQVIGDIPALLRIQAHNRSDEDYYETIDELDLLENRMVVGLRSLDRGSSFVSFINLADEQNPIGISVSAGTGSAFANKLNAPSGRMITHTTPPTGSLSTYADAATITLGPSISRDFYGTYHTYLRAQLVEPSSSPVGDDTDVQVRLSVRSGSGGITKTTKHVRFVGWDENGETFKDWQLLNLGRIDLPVSDLFNDDELPDEFQIVIQVSSTTSTNLEVNLYDIGIIPVDEWAGDFIDTALEDDSGVGNGYKLDIDSVTFPKRRIRALVRSADSSELIRASYQPITPGPAILQANADQRLWFLTARAAYRGEHTGLDNASVLTDNHADFLRAGVKVGQTIFNITDGSSGVVTARTQTTITATLSGGAEDDWDIGDNYLVICNGIYISEPWNCHSIQLERNSRYLSFRGER